MSSLAQRHAGTERRKVLHRFDSGALVAAALVFAIRPTAVLAIASQDQVLKSINEQVGEGVNGGTLLAVFLFVVVAVVGIAFLSYARKRQVQPKTLNHPGKLMKEVAREINLRPAEIKQLRAIADEQGLESPIVLLLCPSVLAKATKALGERVDRNIVAGVARKLIGKP